MHINLCQKRLHQYMYQETYWTDLDDVQREMNRLHNGKPIKSRSHPIFINPKPNQLLTRKSEHCLDFLRQSAMCHGDIGLITFEWSPTNRIPVANATTHQCVNWNKLDQWTKDRSVDMLKPGWLVHPTLGTWYTYLPSLSQVPNCGNRGLLISLVGWIGLAYPNGEGDKIGAATGVGHDHGHWIRRPDFTEKTALVDGMGYLYSFDQ